MSFIVLKILPLPKCPLIDELVNKMLYQENAKLFSHKKNIDIYYNMDENMLRSHT